MRQTFQRLQFLLLAGYLFLSACEKNNEEAPDVSKTSIANKITGWLNQKMNTSPVSAKSETIKALSGHLDLSRLAIEPYKDGENFVVVPVKPGLDLNSPNKTLSNHLVVVVDKNGEIKKGNIIQYLPKDNQPTVLQANTISKIFTFQDISSNGQFAVLSIAGQFRYQLSFENGKFTAMTVVQRDGDSVTARTTGCIDWYWVTTYYWADGSSTETRDYLFRTCDDGSCPPTYLCQNPDSGGGITEEIEYFGVKDADWEVEVAPIGRFYGRLRSYEQLTGNSKKIIKIAHTTEACINAVGSGHPNYASWHKITVTPALMPIDNAAKCTVKGYLTFRGGNSDPKDDPADQQVSDVKVWTPGTVIW